MTAVDLMGRETDNGWFLRNGLKIIYIVAILYTGKSIQYVNKELIFTEISGNNLREKTFAVLVGANASYSPFAHFYNDSNITTNKIY